MVIRHILKAVLEALRIFRRSGKRYIRVRRLEEYEGEQNK